MNLTRLHPRPDKRARAYIHTHTHTHTHAYAYALKPTHPRTCGPQLRLHPFEVVDLLERDDVRGVVEDLRKQVAAPVLPRQQPLAVAREVGGHNEACREKVVAHQREARRLLLPSRRRRIKCRLRQGRPAALVEGEGVRIAAGHLLPLAPAVGASPPPAAPAMRPAARRHLVRDCVQRETQERSCPD